MTEQTTKKSWALQDFLKLASGGPEAAGLKAVDGEIVEMPHKIQRLHDLIIETQNELDSAIIERERLIAENQHWQDEINERLSSLRAKWVDVCGDLGVKAEMPSELGG